MSTYDPDVVYTSHLHDSLEEALYELRVLKQRHEHALKVLCMHPTYEDKNCEGFEWRHFYSQMIDAAGKILEGKA